jgi:hypothetical protein
MSVTDRGFQIGVGVAACSMCGSSFPYQGGKDAEQQAGGLFGKWSPDASGNVGNMKRV